MCRASKKNGKILFTMSRERKANCVYSVNVFVRICLRSSVRTFTIQQTCSIVVQIKTGFLSVTSFFDFLHNNDNNDNDTVSLKVLLRLKHRLAAEILYEFLCYIGFDQWLRVKAFIEPFHKY